MRIVSLNRAPSRVLRYRNAKPGGGGTCDARPAWLAFGEAFRAVAGVNGNHDTFGEESPDAFARRALVHILDGEAREVAGLLESVLLDAPDVLLLHQGPQGEQPRDKGSASVREALLALDEAPPVAFGHCHWAEPLVEVGGRQWLNVDGRAVVLRAA